MAGSVRVEFPGAFCHVMARGNRREPIFLDKEDGKQFVKALGEVCAMTGWRRTLYYADCIRYASIYHAAVHKYGRSAYDSAQKSACKKK